MNMRRGLFRLWIVLAALFVIGVSAAAYRPIREEFRRAGLPADFYDDVSKKYGGETLFPVDCRQARGNAATDYSMDRSYCWYEGPKFRVLYPEYKDLSDHDLSDRIYAKAGMPLTYPRPWTKLLETAGIAFGVPLAVLVIGWSLIWVFSGFRSNPKTNNS